MFACKQTQPVADTKESLKVDSGLLDPLTQQRVRRLYVDACTELMRGDNSAAKQLFEEVLSADPNNHASMFNIAKILIDQRDFDEAIRYGKIAIEKEKNKFNLPLLPSLALDRCFLVHQYVQKGQIQHFPTWDQGQNQCLLFEPIWPLAQNHHPRKSV